MFENDDWKLAIEDTRFRQNAIVALISSSNNQALGLLRLFSVIALATATGAVTSLAAGEFSPTVGWELASLTLVLVWSSWQCFQALEVGDIDLPGRNAEFWLLAADNENDRPTFSRQYLEIFKERYQTNRRVSERQARALRKAKLGGIIAPLIGIGVGALLAFFQAYSL
ncbi:hypothetical protein FHS21_002739 [Phyllobacterium trifolii]|uniref:SMODS and SLOG-associating 2TM effector domain-containing protein n=1 Tax=Phyllobacterium trifolii TaxID=300193 RepID=A0A839U8M6_9HYPH|nr:hypothetical protein [Phyllobacterium trifolii]MBB3146324.1 hypothetical protein [Phyllobacterium trifolii]